MKIAKTMALTGMLTLGSMVGVNAVAAATTPAANGAHARCEQQARDKKLTGQAARDFAKKCEAEAAAAKK
jgi:hypothetical protein